MSLMLRYPEADYPPRRMVGHCSGLNRGSASLLVEWLDSNQGTIRNLETGRKFSTNLRRDSCAEESAPVKSLPSLCVR